MPAAAIGTLVFTGLLVAALAIYLITIFFILRRILNTLGLVCFGVRAIAHRAEPLTPMLSDVNRNLTPVADALENVANKATTRTTVEPQPPARFSYLESSG